MIVRHTIHSRLPDKINLNLLQSEIDTRIGEGVGVAVKWNEDLTPLAIQVEFEDNLGYAAEAIESVVRAHRIPQGQKDDFETAIEKALAAEAEAVTLKEVLANYNNILTRLDALEATIKKG